jgi:acyl-CoA thioesterase-1
MFRSLIVLLFYIVPLHLHAADRTLLVLADSLSASYGIAIEDGWVSLLQKRLQDTGHDYNVINASISGDTTHGAKSRLDEILGKAVPAITIVELGGNDGLRGLPVAEISKNLGEIITLLKNKGSSVLLVPMLLPPNYGKIYIEKFSNIYKELAASHEIILGRFILDGIAIRPELMQADGIHPKAEAQPMMLDNIWADLEPMLTGEGKKTP